MTTDSQVPFELQRSTPRPVRLSVAGKAAAASAILLLAAAIVAGAWIPQLAAQAAARRERFLREGVDTMAEVTSLGPVRDDRRSVRYRYTAGGQVYSGRATLTRRQTRGLEAGSPIAVRYLPSDPADSHVGRGAPQGVPFWVAPLAATLAALLALLIVYCIRRQWVLLAEGRATMGRVTAVKRRLVAHQHGAHHTNKVRYEFQLLTGATATGSYDTGDKRAPAAGSPLVVLYDRDRPRRSARYPLALVRVQRY